MGTPSEGTSTSRRALALGSGHSLSCPSVFGAALLCLCNQILHRPQFPVPASQWDSAGIGSGGAGGHGWRASFPVLKPVSELFAVCDVTLRAGPPLWFLMSSAVWLDGAGPSVAPGKGRSLEAPSPPA